MNNHVEQIKERLSIVDVVSSYIKIEKAGVNFRARCPFHNEKTPSFFISPSRNTYHCFGCNAGGDIFSFVEQFEGTDFKGALKILAERAGVELSPVNREKEDKKARLFQLLEETAHFFEMALARNQEARVYLRGRGMQDKTIAAWRIGYARDEWRSLMEHLEAKGYSKAEMESAGVIKRTDSKPEKQYDRFRGRIMFPITDTSGRVIAFTGRIVPLKSNREYKEDTAKYLNSPETDLFQKSKILYGFAHAKQAIRKLNFSILVEGQLDVILSHQAGYTNTVAASGTALTDDQLALLGRLSNNLVMAFDADQAGLLAQGKGIDRALVRGMDVKVAALPPGSDPADLIQKSVEEWRATIKNAKHVIDFYLDHLQTAHSDARKLRLAVGEIVIPYIAQIPHRIDQAHFVAQVADRLALSEAPIWEAVRDAARRDAAERSMPDTASERAVAAHKDTSRYETITRHLVALLLWQESIAKEKRMLDSESLRTQLTEGLGKAALEQYIAELAHDGERLMFEAEQVHEDERDLEVLAEAMFNEWKKEHLKRQYEDALGVLRKAEQGGDQEEVKEALRVCRELSAQLRE